MLFFLPGILALLIRLFVMRPCVVTSGSMLDSIRIGDRLLINRLAYGLRHPRSGACLFDIGSAPRPGEVIVFRCPARPEQEYLKRVVGCPGDVIEMRTGRLFRNGHAVEEPYVRTQAAEPGVSGPAAIAGGHFGPLTVPEKEYFVLGDNRGASADSRVWGTVRRDAIVGRAELVLWSRDARNRRLRLERTLRPVSRL